MAMDITKIITNEAISYFTEETQERIGKDILSLLNEIKSWLDKYNSLNERLRTIINKRKSIENLTRFSRTHSNKVYDISRSAVKSSIESLSETNAILEEKTQTNILLEHTKKGYRLLHSLRELLTGQEITYDILFSSLRDVNKKNQLMEAHLSIDQLLDIVQIDYTDIKKYEDASTDIIKATKMTISEGALRKLIISNNEEDNYNITNIKNEKLWNRILDALTKAGIKYNKGRAYEVYKQLNIKHETSNYWNSTIIKVYNEANKDSVQGWKGGDFGLIQLKSVLDNSTAALSATNATIYTILKKIYNSFTNNKNKDIIAKALINIFTPTANKARGKIEKEIAMEAVNYIRDSFGYNSAKSLKGKTLGIK